MDKEAILAIAEEIGQKEALEKLFEFAPESQANYWATVDFNKSSNEKRFFIFDIKKNRVKSYLVAHGKNSGEEYATIFSNVNGSLCSSLGIYKTRYVFDSFNNGRALLIKGMEDTNSNAELREIIIHKADYVVPNYQGTGRAGRSHGCFVFHPTHVKEVIDNLRNGSYFNAWRN